MTDAPPFGLAPGLTRRYGDALRAGDAGMAESVIDSALADGLPPEAVQSLVVESAMVRIGELWEDNAVTVADEHLATAISYNVLIRLYEALTVAPPRSRQTIMLAAPEGQHHVLGLRMIADVLEGAGFVVLFLGADVPAGALRDAIRRHQPDIVGLSVGLGTDVSVVAAAILAVHQEAPRARVMLGGRAVPLRLGAMGYPLVQCSLDVLPAVESLLAESGPPAQASMPALEHMASVTAPHAPRTDSAPDAVAQQLADATAHAADRAREYVRSSSMYKDLALRDHVTGLGNRRSFDDRLFEETHAGRKEDLGALLMIDVDAFKNVNDAHGHEVGDKLLKFIADAIVESIRDHDFAARFGGDEFAVLLPTADVETAATVGSRIAERVRRQAQPPVTISIGVAPIGLDGRSAVLAADGALYRAKSCGRDRVMRTVVVAGSARIDVALAP
ncbi:MAG: diguanylate cyclase [Solirubrobacteraceae bacterium]